MKFSEKLRLERQKAHLTQEELAKRLGLAKRTVEGYESGAFYPRRRKVYDDLALLFGVDKNWFLTEDEAAPDESGASEADQILSRVRALYAGGRLSEEDKDALARALMDAYWMARRRAAEGDDV